MINTYVNYPRNMQPDQGDSVAYFVKGIVVYIKEGDARLILILKWCEFISGVAVGVLAFLHAVGRRRSGN